MPHITGEQLKENAETLRRILNTRFGYQHALGSVLEHCIDYDDAQKALKAASNRDFDTFFSIVNIPHKDGRIMTKATENQGLAKVPDDQSLANMLRQYSSLAGVAVVGHQQAATMKAAADRIEALENTIKELYEADQTHEIGLPSQDAWQDAIELVNSKG